MKVITGEVTGGAVQVPEDLPDGTRVAILAPGDEGFRLSPNEETELEEALQQIRSGEFVDGRELLAELRDDLKSELRLCRRSKRGFADPRCGKMVETEPSEGANRSRR